MSSQCDTGPLKKNIPASLMNVGARVATTRNNGVRTMVLAIRLRASRTSANSLERIASSVVGTVSFFLRRK